MKKLYFILCLALCATFLVTNSYGQTNSVTFDFGSGNTANGHKDIWSTKNDYVLRVASNYNTLHVLGIGGSSLIGPAYNVEKLTTFSIDDKSPFDLRSIDVFNNSNDLTNIVIKTSKGGSATMQIGGNNYNVFSLPVNDEKFKQITSFTVEGSSELNKFQYDNVKLDNITDIIAPKINSVTSISVDNKIYTAGDEISIQLNFAEKVNVTGVPKLALETGVTDRNAEYVSGSGTSVLTFKYTVREGDVTGRLNYISQSALILDNGTIKDRGGNSPDPLPPTDWRESLGGSKNLVVDAVKPTVISVSSTADNRHYKVGDLISIRVNFSELVNVVGTPQLQLETGTTDRKVAYKSGSGGSTLFFDYTVQAGDLSADLDYLSTTALTLNEGTIKDAAGNEAILTLPAIGAAGSLSANKDLIIDGVVPTVVSINSSDLDKTYKLGDVIYIQVNLSENATITGYPQLTLETGAVNRVASYWSGTGTSSIFFRYTVQDGDNSTDLDYTTVEALSLNGGTMKDAAGNNIVLTLPSPGATNSLSANKNIVIDGIVPTVVSVSSSAIDKTYKSGDQIDIEIAFSKKVIVTGIPQLTLETGATDRTINYSSGSGTSTLTFKYTVEVGDASADLDYVSTNSLSFNGGSIKDGSDNVAIITLPTPGSAKSLAGNKAIVIDGAPPVVVSVSSSNANRSYRIGDLIYIWVYFSENVTVTGTPQLTLKTGATNRLVNYATGTGTSSIRFDYTVQLGDYTNDLDYLATNSLSLNGGTIKDARGNNFILTLPSPGATGSIAATKNIVIAQIKPNADGVLFVNNQTFDYTENGTTWSTAIRELSNALKLAKTQSNIKQIWVRTGTYYPKYSAADDNFGNEAGRDNAFLMLKNVPVYGGFNGSETTITQRNGSARTTLSGDLGVAGNTDNAYHVVVFSGDAGTAALNGFTVTGGNANGVGDVTVNSKPISRGVAGGIYLNSSSPILTNLTVNGNATTGSGGGIYNTSSSSPVLSNATVNSNTAANGAGIYNVDNSSPILTDVTINSNTATANGAGIYNIGTSSPKLTNVNVSGNSAWVNGGGIYNANASSPLLTNVIIRGNKAGADGAGIYSAVSSAPVLTNVTLSGNWAVTNGGALYNQNSSPKIYNSILFGNSSGVYNTSSTPAFYNSIVQESGGSNSWLAAIGTNGGNNLDVDPKFKSAPNYNTAPFTGGDYNLKASSQAIDAASNAYFTGLSATSTDLQGKPRAYNYASNGIVDMGAFEYQSSFRTNAQGVLFVKKGSNGSGSAWTDAMGEFADALKIAKTFGDVDQIWVGEGTYHPLYSPADNNFGNNADRNNAFLLVKDVKIYGGFAGTETTTKQRDTLHWANKSILSGDLGIIDNNTDNAYHVVIAVGDMGRATLNGFTITKGNAGGGNEQNITVNGQSLRSYFFGGLLLNGASPELTNLSITENNAQNGGGGIGITLAARPTIKNSIISGNSSSLSGGGVYINATSPTFINVIISGNNASNSAGGIYFNSSSSSVFTNVTISGNKATTMGGALHIQSTGSLVPSFYNSIVYGNNTGVSAQSTTVGAKYYNSIVQGSRGSGNWLSTIGFNGGDNLDVDPLFISAPIANGAPFTGGNYKLQRTSPAINAGDNSYYTDLVATSLDLAGKPRVSDYSDGATIDMGAYEYQTSIAPNADGVLFVKKGSTGKGASWINAVGELADALKEAKTNTEIKQIWVAAGTYNPLYSPADNNFGNGAGRENAFLLVKDVKVYGGFAGTESGLSQRNFNTNISTLTGDLGGSENSYNVVISSGTMGLATLDGFTIRDGNASSSSYIYVNGNQVYQCSGAGIYNSVSDADYKNLIVMNNFCGESGGGMFSYRSSVRLNHVTMKNNGARHGGAMANQDNSHATVVNSLFTGNSSSDGGGAIYNVDGSLPKFVNITVAQNTGNTVNGISNESNALPEVYNSIIWDTITGNYNATYSLVRGANPTGTGNINATVILADIFTDYANGDYTLKTGSPAIKAGSNSLFNGLTADTKDLAGNTRAYNFATGGTIDIGAYEYQGTLSQIISFAALDPKNTASADFALSATATSGLKVSYTSDDTAIADVYEDSGVWKVKIKKAGEVEITAKQAGDGNYAAATDVAKTLVVIDAVLPVELTSYTAKVEGNYAKLQWQTTNERNNKGYIIYRSGDDRKFIQIGEVSAASNLQSATYNYLDKQPLNGNNYYKLVQLDLDGKPAELGVKPLNFVLSVVNFNVYPNPTKDRVTVSLEAAKYTKVSLGTVDGKVLKSISLSTQQDQLEIDLSAYPSGTYFIRLTDAKESIVKKVVKQ
ncbi:MAG: T9SS type A sorting domain-containing protein [Sphingobacteriaceae bacterium]|nr:MAG: T9SS type A sorting domain-containing protein [Sphingobacteriaceae bacterium]